MMHFKEFVSAYRDGSIVKDAAWRAYNIERMVTAKRVREGMRTCGYRYVDHMSLSALAAAYGLGTAEQAKHLVGLWWTWRRIANGDAKRGLVLREQHNDD